MSNMLPSSPTGLKSNFGGSSLASSLSSPACGATAACVATAGKAEAKKQKEAL